MRFFVGLHHPSDAKHFQSSFISVNALARRKGDFAVGGDWILDSGAFSAILLHGGFPEPPEQYARAIARWSKCGNLLAGVSQDFMVEPFMLERTGLRVEDHQRLTIERYDALHELVNGTYVMPVLQGFAPSEYIEHLEQYGDRLAPGAWVGVGSVCKRQGDVALIETILATIKARRPDIKCHGFGLKKSALKSGRVRELLFSADSMAWSFAARKNGRNPNDWREARGFVDEIESAAYQLWNGL